jgi:hypothetical protein
MELGLAGWILVVAYENLPGCRRPLVALRH